MIRSIKFKKREELDMQVGFWVLVNGADLGIITEIKKTPEKVSILLVKRGIIKTVNISSIIPITVNIEIDKFKGWFTNES